MKTLLSTLALIVLIAGPALAVTGDNHPKSCVHDKNGVPNADCQITGGGNGPDQR